MAKREKNPASDKTGNDTGISLLVLGIVSVIFALWIPIVGIAVVNWILAIVLTFMTLA